MGGLQWFPGSGSAQTMADEVMIQSWAPSDFASSGTRAVVGIDEDELAAWQTTRSPLHESYTMMAQDIKRTERTDERPSRIDADCGG